MLLFDAYVLKYKVQHMGEAGSHWLSLYWSRDRAGLGLVVLRVLPDKCHRDATFSVQAVHCLLGSAGCLDLDITLQPHL